MNKLQLLIATLSLASCLLTVNAALAARLIKVRVELDGEVLLEGSHNDDGRADADGVWRFYTQSNAAQEKWAGLSETRHFSEDSPEPIASGKDSVILKAPRGKKLTVSVLYGGEAKVRELTLHRVEPLQETKDGKKTGNNSGSTKSVWYLDSKQLKALFAKRMITRRQAAGLKHPENLEE